MKSKITFSLEKPVHKHKTLQRVTEFTFISQLIICGSLSAEFLTGLFGEKFEYNEEEKYQAFLFTSEGKAWINAVMDLDTLVVYKESREKNRKSEIAWDHKDDLHQDNLVPNYLRTNNNYVRAKPDFASPHNTWIIIAASDLEEHSVIMRALKAHVNHGKFKISQFFLPLKTLDLIPPIPFEIADKKLLLFRKGKCCDMKENTL